MHPRIAELLEHLDRERAALRSSVDAIPSELRARRPAPERWSVAEVLEHLGRVERGLTRLFVTRLEEARTRGLEPERETGPVLPTFDMARVRDRTRPVTARDASLPSGTLDASAAWSELEAARSALRAAVLAADGLALGEVVHPNPVLGPLNLYQWVAFVGAHEARHAAQIREIGSQLTERAALGADGQGA